MNLAKARILAIDDTPVNLLSLGAMLSNEFDLQIAVSGAEGLKLAAQTTPDLVLLDIMMPGMDGYEVCQRLKEDPVLRDIPVVFVTALTEADSEARGLALGAADYISKPINVEIARHRIRNLLERERLRKQIKSQYEILQEQIAQREQAQSALRESEELFRAVSESANDAIVTSNSLGDIVTWNGGAQRIFGYMQQEAVGARLTMLMPQRLHAPHLAGMQRVLSGGQRHVMGQPVELIGRRKDGGEFPLELSLAHWQSGSGQFFTGVMRDITQRKRDEETARAASLYARSLIEASLDPLVMISSLGKITDVNTATEKVTGLERDKLIGNDFTDYFTNPEKAREVYEQVFKNGYVTDYPLAIRHVSGGITDVMYNASVYSDESGEILGVFAAARDISEQKKAAMLLQESESHLKAIIENEPECIKVIDAQGLLIQMNAAGLRMVEAEFIDQVKGKPVLDLIAPEYRQAFMDLHQRVIAGATVQMEFEVIGLNGGRRRLETHAAPLQENGQTVHLAVTRDITQRKLMEDQIRQLAFHDSLTLLPNRRLLLDRLSQAISASKRSGRYIALLYLDLDNFKSLNDTHGHDMGDLLLIEVAKRLIACVREVDTVSRFGGDEFVVLLTDLNVSKDESKEQARVIAEKIRCALAEPYLLATNNGGTSNTTVCHRCSASIGVTMVLYTEGDVGDILKRADAAMYQAKEEGRNLIRFYEN